MTKEVEVDRKKHRSRVSGHSNKKEDNGGGRKGYLKTVQSEGGKKKTRTVLDVCSYSCSTWTMMTSAEVKRGMEEKVVHRARRPGQLRVSTFCGSTRVMAWQVDLLEGSIRLTNPKGVVAASVLKRELGFFSDVPSSSVSHGITTTTTAQ
jgi:hypothetical protein